MKKGRILTALCAALMCLFMLGGCAGCDGEGGGGGKTEVDLIKDVIAEKCDYSKFIFQKLTAEKVSSQTSNFVSKSSAEVYGNISFFTKTEDEFDISHIGFSIYPPACKMMIGIAILDIDSSTPHFKESKTIDFSALTLEQRQQGQEIKWDFNKLSIKGAKSNSENAVITIGFSFLHENGNYIEMYKLSDESEFNSFKFNIGNLAMK